MLRGCLILLAFTLSACGASREPQGFAPLGPGPRYQQPSLNRAVATAEAVGALDCARRAAGSWVHVELFAHGKVVIVPAGIGVAPPRTEDGAYVRGGRCRYPLFTEEPTGLVGMTRAGLTLGDLFRIWDRPLTRGGLAGFAGDVRVHVNGGRWSGPPGDVPLRPYDQIVVEAGFPRIEPHATYRFPKGY